MGLQGLCPVHAEREEKSGQNMTKEWWRLERRGGKRRRDRQLKVSDGDGRAVDRGQERAGRKESDI